MNNENVKIIYNLIDNIKSNIDIEKFNLCCFERIIDGDKNIITYAVDIYIYVKDIINKNVLKLLIHKVETDKLVIFIYLNDNPVVIENIRVSKNSKLNENDLNEFIFSLIDIVNQI